MINLKNKVSHLQKSQKHYIPLHRLMPLSHRPRNGQWPLQIHTSLRKQYVIFNQLVILGWTMSQKGCCTKNLLICIVLLILSLLHSFWYSTKNLFALSLCNHFHISTYLTQQPINNQLGNTHSAKLVVKVHYSEIWMATSLWLGKSGGCIEFLCNSCSDQLVAQFFQSDWQGFNISIWFLD